VECQPCLEKLVRVRTQQLFQRSRGRTCRVHT
jgi:hypothetical protein